MDPSDHIYFNNALKWKENICTVFLIWFWWIFRASTPLW